MDLVEYKMNQNKIKGNDLIPFATVVDVNSAGYAKIKFIDESNPVDTYYQSTVKVNQGDRVRVEYISGTYIVTGNLTTQAGGGADGVTKDYIDEQDQAVREYVDSKDSSMKTYIDTQDAANKTYTDTEVGVVDAKVSNKLDKVSSLGTLANLAWYPYKVSDTNFCNVGCSGDGIFYLNVGTNSANRKLYRFGYGTVEIEMSTDGGATWKKIATTDNVTYLKNKTAIEQNTVPSDYINKLMPNGARQRAAIGLPGGDYWYNTFGVNSLNGDTGVTEFAVDSNNMYFRTQKGHANISDWNGASWKQMATSDKIDVSLQNGWVASSFRVNNLSKIGNRVIGTISIQGGTISYDSIISTLPVGYRPNSVTDIFGMCNKGTSPQLISLFVTTDGSIKCNKVVNNIDVVIDVDFYTN